jgi:hypothetical protein
VDPRAGLDDEEKRKFLTLPGLNSDPSVVQPVASRYTDSQVPLDGIVNCLYTFGSIKDGNIFNSLIYQDFPSS